MSVDNPQDDPFQEMILDLEAKEAFEKESEEKEDQLPDYWQNHQMGIVVNVDGGSVTTWWERTTDKRDGSIIDLSGGWGHHMYLTLKDTKDSVHLCLKREDVLKLKQDINRYLASGSE